MPGFRGEAAFGTWLHAIVARRSIDRTAVLKRRRAGEVGFEEARDRVETAAPVAAPSVGETSLRLDRLLERLSPVRRAAVAIARVLGMPENTVKTHLSRARAAQRRGWLAGEDS